MTTMTIAAARRGGQRLLRFREASILLVAIGLAGLTLLRRRS